ncbi:MAG: hypothetical protein DCC55_15455 [Chloroflexi bacterium]|nr:MAG: hypothetical protein DCC55_15455 [Chloroflexota bacterium]
MATKKQHPNVNVSFRRKELYYMVGALKEQLHEDDLAERDMARIEHLRKLMVRLEQALLRRLGQ